MMDSNQQSQLGMSFVTYLYVCVIVEILVLLSPHGDTMPSELPKDALPGSQLQLQKVSHRSCATSAKLYVYTLIHTKESQMALGMEV